MTPSNRYDVILYGGPASGKSTQARLLAGSLDGVAIEVGKRLRELAEEDTPLGHIIADTINQGQLIPHDKMMELAKQWVMDIPDTQPVILDGATRDVGEAKYLDAVLDSLNRKAVMVYLEVPIDEVKRRIMERAKTEGRADDVDPVAVENRINYFLKESEGILDYYKSQDRLITVSGDMSVEDLAAEIKEQVIKWHSIQNK